MYGGGRQDRRDRGSTAIIGMAAFLLYFISNLLVLYGSRIREYYADQGSVQLGNPPHQLASALYKLTYSSAKLQSSATGKQALTEIEGFRAFFLNDVGKAYEEFETLKDVDHNLSGSMMLGIR